MEGERTKTNTGLWVVLALAGIATAAALFSGWQKSRWTRQQEELLYDIDSDDGPV